MKLYALFLIKGKQLYKVGDNIKDHLENKEEFKEKKLLDWGTSFLDDIYDGYSLIKAKLGYTDTLGKKVKPKNEKDLINSSIVIVNGKGIIRGILEINKNNREELKEN